MWTKEFPEIKAVLSIPSVNSIVYLVVSTELVNKDCVKMLKTITSHGLTLGR